MSQKWNKIFNFNSGGEIMEDRIDKLQELIKRFVEDVDELGFEILGDNEGCSIVLEITDIK